ncbi:4-fold beta flower protein [Subsaxibacter sp. CAU 1640]|uniref:4-fold beta flower protein n=1 Tax=Subsaxibacter sp. CAU 1640 TaxID=2933271 RepID=UPI0039818933
MKPLYNKQTKLVGWLSDDKLNIFDSNLDWVGLVAADQSIWSVHTKDWIGNLNGTNIHDTSGHIIFYNPETPIENRPKPPIPTMPLQHTRPEPPLQPMRRTKPICHHKPELIWAKRSWQKFFKY